MYINTIFELSMVLSNEKFHKILNRTYSKANYLEDEEYIDLSLAFKGITVKYRDSQYKKKVKLIINAGMALNSDNADSNKFIGKLDKRINEYFDYEYRMDDFTMSGMILAADIDVHSRESVMEYLKVLRRIGKIKGFSPSSYECFDDIESFCLEGNSNGIEFLLYDLESYIVQKYGDIGAERKKLKSMLKEAEGILRTEVRLTKLKAIRDYTDAADVSGQIMALSEKRQDIFLNIFTRIIPFGDFYKKNKAIEIIRKEVNDSIMRRRMFRLLVLIPEKKSLYLAQKAMNCRNVEKVMDAFAKINLSPVTISKRQDMKHLKNIYAYFLEE